LSVVVCLLKVSDALQTEFADVVQVAVGGHFEGRTYMMNKNNKILLVITIIIVIIITITTRTIILLHKTIHS